MSRRRVVLALLGALVVIDVAVVAIALNRTTAQAGSVDVAPAPLPGTDDSAAPVEPTATTPSPSTSTPPPAPPAGAPLARWIDVVSGDEVWRASAATCPERSVIERTTDGGETWTELNSPAAVTRLNAQEPGAAFLVGTAGDDCEVSFWSTGDASTWAEQSGSLGAAWYLESEGVHSPSGSQAVPCTGAAVDLVARTQTAAAVLCADGSVHATEDGADEWTAVGTHPGALALARAGDAFLVAAVGLRGCPGVVVLEAAEEPIVRGCAGGSGAAPGRVAIAALDESIWVWAGDRVLVSTDGGATWG